MAVLALAFVGAGIGAAIGGTFLGVSAAAIGWAAGSALGSLLFAPDGPNQQGPRIGDLSVQASVYGIMKPIVYGAMRLNGNVIFSTNKREVANTQEIGGKGGSSATSTTYTYNVDMAIALCECEIAGIRKVFNNGQLIYDVSWEGDIYTVLASNLNAAAFKIYYGTETQLPDPTIEATVGVGQVPGYRGMAYVVFTQLDCPNGQIPQLSFEVLTQATDIARVLEYGVLENLPSGANATRAIINEDGAFQYGYDPVRNFWYVNQVGPGFVERLRSPGAFAQPPRPCQGGGEPYALVAYGGDVYSWKIGEEGITLIYDGDSSALDFVEPTASYLCAHDEITGKFAASATLVNVPSTTGVAIFPSGLFIDSALATAPCAIYDNILYAWNVDTLHLDAYNAETGVLIRQFDPPAGADYGSTIPLATAQGLYLCFLGAPISVGSSDKTIWKWNGSDWDILVFEAAVSDPGGQYRTFWCNDEYALFGPSAIGVNSNYFYLVPFRSIDSVDPYVADIIEDIAVRAGMAASDIDVTEVTSTVHGFAIASVSSARANILPLQKCFFIDSVESDGKLKFRPRASIADAAFIPFDDLGTSENGDADQDALALQRTQEIELPRSVAISYIDHASDYRTGTETSRRIITDSVNDLVENLAVATDPDRAATVADVLLYDAWNERNKRSLSVMRKYAALDAGDVVTIEYPRGVTTAKRLVSANDTGVLIEFQAVDSDAEIYLVDVPGATPPNSQPGVPLLSPSRLEVLDIPLLRDVDNNPGVYVAMNGLTDYWPGAVLYMGIDDASLIARGAVTAGAPMGLTETALDDWPSLIMDEANTVDVRLNRGELFSATRDAIFDTDANAALIGDEIIKFKTATLISDLTYRLSGLLRGLRGTERARDTHAIGERFVLLRPVGMLRPLYDVSELNSPRRFRAVTLGMPLSSAKSITETNTGEALRPFNPVNLRRSTSSNNITLTWDRRTRSTTTFPANGVDVPLFEATEAYSVDVYTPGFGAIVRTIDSATPTITYTAAQQTADGLTPGAAVSVRVYQVSASVGRGHYLEGTI